MKTIKLFFCFLLIKTNLFGQTNLLNDFYVKVYSDENFKQFISENAPTFNLADKNTSSKKDTTPVTKLSTFTFKKHPQLDSSSLGGRLEMFTSVCADGSCVYEASQKVFVSFSSDKEANKYLDNLLSKLSGLDIKKTYNKNKGTDEYKLTTSTDKRQIRQLVLKLGPGKTKKTFDLYIGTH
jgi:hypothetical protein